MADVREKVEQIRQAVYGKEVRESIASGIEAINTDIDALNDLVDALDSRVDTIITTPISGEAAAQEIVDARASAVKSKTFATLDARFEESEQDLVTHKAESVTDADGAHGLKIETGIWTPTLFGGTVAGSHTYHPDTAGKYIRENKKAICFFRLEVSTVDPLMSGGLRVGNFPFVVKNDNAMRATLNIGLASKITLPEGYTQLVGAMTPGSSYAYFSGIGSNKSAYTLQASDVVSGLRIFGTVTYEIA